MHQALVVYCESYPPQVMTLQDGKEFWDCLAGTAEGRVFSSTSLLVHFMRNRFCDLQPTGRWN